MQIHLHLFFSVIILEEETKLITTTHEKKNVLSHQKIAHFESVQLLRYRYEVTSRVT